MENEDKEFYTSKDHYEAYMSEFSRFLRGEISLVEAEEAAGKYKPPTLIEFVEKTNNLKLERWQKTLLTSLYYGNKISHNGSRRYGKKILVDGAIKYKKQIENN